MNKFEIVDLQKMIFIYNALEKGWSIKKIKDDKFEFKKPKGSEILELNNFIENNLNIDNIIKKIN